MADPATAAIIGAGLSAGSNIFGGLLGQSAADANRAAAEAHYWNNYNFANQQFQWQKELAMNGIRMKVNDAKASGIHPLYALGAVGPSFSPVSHVDGGTGAEPSQWPSAMRSMGQDLNRAALATATPHERQMSILETERAHLGNELLRAQIRNLNNQVGPPLPIPGSGTSSTGMAAHSGNKVTPTLGTYEAKPTEVNTSQPGNTPIAAGPGAPYVQFADVGTGLRPMPAPGMKVEDEFGAPLMAQWMADVYANPERYKPSLGQIEAKFGKGAVVEWDYHRMEWRKSTPFAHMPTENPYWTRLRRSQNPQSEWWRR